MTRRVNGFSTAIMLIGLVACSNEKAAHGIAKEEVDLAGPPPEVSYLPASDDVDGTVVNSGAPFGIGYRIIGTPIVGSPLTIDLLIESALGAVDMQLSYRINDATALRLAESQPENVAMEAAANETSFNQQVTVIPLRDGRLYLYVSAAYEAETGTRSTVTAIPVQVGSGTRRKQQQSELAPDENGAAIRASGSE